LEEINGDLREADLARVVENLFRGVTSGLLARRGVRVEPADLPSNRSQLRNERTFSDAHCRRVIGFLPKIRSTRSVVAASRPSRIARHNATCASVSSCEPLILEYRSLASSSEIT
jgi:hypothetical protein